MAYVTVSLDMFPVRVQIPRGGSVEPARVIVADDVLSVWTSSTGGPSVFFTRPALSVEGSRMTGYAVGIEEGVVVATKIQGCGCGNALKSFNPFGEDTVRVMSA